MTLLSVDNLYALAGERPGDDNKATDRPRVLQVRLPAEMLSQLIRHDGRLSITDGREADPILAIDDVPHILQRVIASTNDSPLHLHSFASTSDTAGAQAASSQPQYLEYIGEMQYKLTAKSHVVSSSSITSKLKERREMEEARKSEHRAVLLDAAPLTRKSPATSKLKLKPKGLTSSASNSPLIRSRAATPNELGSPATVSNSLVNKANTASGQQQQREQQQQQQQQQQLKSSPLKRDSSPNGLRRLLLQLMAMGPLSRRQIVQKIPFAEPQIVSMLPRLATAPEHLQPSTASGSAQRKFSGPINRRSQQSGSPAKQSSPSRSPPGDKGPSTVFVLSDEAYREVLVKDWPDYDAAERSQVSTLMESALDRLGVQKSAIERSQLIHIPPQKGQDKTFTVRQSDRARANTESDGKDAAMATDPSAVLKMDTGNSKKPTTKQRLAKAAKGRLASAQAATTAKAASKTNEMKEVILSSKAPYSAPLNVSTTVPALKRAPHSVETKASANTTKRSSVTLARTSSTGGNKPRKDIEYTDSSEEESIKNSEATKTAHIISENTSRRTVSSTATRGRQPVGRGALMIEEPWLEVHNEREWHELAKRFKRQYDEYQTGLARVRDVEEMLRQELELARAEATEEQSSKTRPATRRQTRNSAGTSGRGGDAEMLDANDEREEGEASPTIEQGNTAAEASTLENGPFAWRTSRDNVAKGEQKSKGRPMVLEEMDALVASVLGLEGQLKRMKSTLQSSKERLEA